MPIIVWTQIANAFTMISPLIAWWHHRNTKRQKECRELFRLRRTLILHIPISFLYHMVSGLNVRRCVRGLLKACDLSLVHVYALQACKTIKKIHGNGSLHLSKLPRIPLLLNSYCITRVCRGYEDTKLRMSSLYICTQDAIQHVKCTRTKCRMFLLGAWSSVLFYWDEQMMRMGHSMFHILLGFLHHEILGLVVM
jgi:hypothetical protein